MLALRDLNSTKKKYMIPDSLTHGGGIISAVFGSTGYSVALSGLSANTRYQLYLVPGGTLVISINENSVGPSGQTSWLLVGSFYTNHISAFGAFVESIEGSPRTGIITNGAIEITGSGGNPTKGTIVTDYLQWWREGRFILAQLFYRQSTNGTANVGYIMLSTPAGAPGIDPVFHPYNTETFSGVSGTHQTNVGKIGIGELGNAPANTENAHAVAHAVTSSKFRVWVWDGNTGGAHTIGGWGSNFFSFHNNPNMGFNFDIKYHGIGLSDRPIKDL